MSSQRVAIFGANGNVGRLLVDYALADGFLVTAFVHKSHTLPDNPRMTIVQGDINNPGDIANALDGCSAVLCALSSWHAPEKDVLAMAMTNIIPAMQKLEIARIVSLTGAEARATGDELTPIHRFAHVALGLVAGGVLRDGEKHIALLEQSGLDWVVIRSPIMRPKAGETYGLTNTRPLSWATVNRAAVARAMINQLADEHNSQQAPFIR